MDGRPAEADADTTADRREGSLEATSADREVDEVGDESFPASDPPQWWSGRSPDDVTEDE